MKKLLFITVALLCVNFGFAQNDNSAPRTTKVAGLFQFNTPSQPLTALTAHGAAPLPANWVACCHLRLRLARPGVGQRCLLRRGEGA